MTKPSQSIRKLTQLDYLRMILWGFILFGILLRLIQYLSNRSLWLDEAMLALNVIDRPFIDLFSPLDYNQGAPLGFLFMEKISFEVFGKNEFALRLFPFLCGVISIPLFYKVSKHFLTVPCSIFAAGIFSLSYKLIYYSSELKQYSSDVFFTLIVYLTAVHLDKYGFTLKRFVAFGIIGAIAIWFSHSSIFILSGIGFVTLTSIISRGERWAAFLLVIPFIIWAASFTAFYIISLDHLSQNETLLNYWSSGFMPFPPQSLSELKWFDATFFHVFKDPFGLFPSSLSALIFLIGMIAMAIEKRKQFLLLIFPVILTLFASALHKYPFIGRLLLFLFPIFLLFISHGVKKFEFANSPYNSTLKIIIIILIFLPQLVYSSSVFIKPITHEEIKPVIGYMSKHWRSGDIVYVYHGALPTFKFYASKYGFNDDDFILGKGTRQNIKMYKNEIEDLGDYKRLWILFSHIDKKNGINDEEIFLDYLNTYREKIASFKTKSSRVHLYRSRL